MKKILPILFSVSLLIGACNKSSNKDCYECDTQMDGEYRDVGCWTRSQWNETGITDYNGNLLDKSRYCRKR